MKKKAKKIIILILLIIAICYIVFSNYNENDGFPGGLDMPSGGSGSGMPSPGGESMPF